MTQTWNALSSQGNLSRGPEDRQAHHNMLMHSECMVDAFDSLLGAPLKKPRTEYDQTESDYTSTPNWWRFGEIQRSTLPEVSSQLDSNARGSESLSFQNFGLDDQRRSIEEHVDTQGRDNKSGSQFKETSLFCADFPQYVRPKRTNERDILAEQEENKTSDVEQPNILTDNMISKGSLTVRFRSHQAESWMAKFEELLDFRLKNGHCLVPNAFKDNLSLAEWVKRQRYQHKLKILGQHSTMTDDRMAALEKLEFVWNSHDAVWEERLKELKEYKAIFNDCNVATNYEPNPQLAIWIKRQRRQMKFSIEGETSTMTPYRLERLTELGFAWSGRKSKTSYSK